MKKIAVLFIVISSVVLFAQKSRHDYLMWEDFQDLCRRRPHMGCDMNDSERLYHHFNRFFSLYREDRQEFPYYHTKTAGLQNYDSSWEEIGPEGGWISAMAFNPQNKSEMYASEQYGNIYKSSNSGQTWQRIATLNYSIYSIAVDPSNQNIIYALNGSRIFKSEDGGSNWQIYQFESYTYSSAGEIAINPNNSDIIYVAGYYRDPITWKYFMAVLKSTDGGKNWTVKKISPPSESGRAICVAADPLNPSIIYCGGYYINDNYYYKVYKSSDGGENWTDIGGSITGYPETIAIDPTNPSKVYVGTYAGVYRSSDGGETWRKNRGYVYTYKLAIDPLNTDVLYAGYDKCCYKSTDGGENWIRYFQGIYGSCYSLIASSATPTKVFYGSNTGIYRSDDSGVFWEEGHSGILATHIPALAIAPSSSNIIYAEVANNGFFKSTDFGNSWVRLPDFYRCDAILKIIINPNDANDLFILAGG